MAYDRNLGDSVKITILASGFSISVDGHQSHETGSGAKKVEFSKNESEDSERENADRLAMEYGKESVDRINAEKARARYIVLKPSQMDDDRFIDAFEKSPTYNREKKTSDDIKAIGATGTAPVETVREQTPFRPATPDTTIKFK